MLILPLASVTFFSFLNGAKSIFYKQDGGVSCTKQKYLGTIGGLFRSSESALSWPE